MAATGQITREYEEFERIAHVIKITHKLALAEIVG